MSTALLVIDVQRSLLDEGPWQGDELLATVRQLIDRAREAGALVVFIRDSRVEPDGSIDSSLHPLPGDLMVTKDFCDSFLDTGLHETLQAGGIGTLVVCGMQTDYCIDTTCRRAASLGYRVLLASDAHTTFDRDFLSAENIVRHHNQILGHFAAAAGSVRTIEADEVAFAGPRGP